MANGNGTQMTRKGGNRNLETREKEKQSRSHSRRMGERSASTNGDRQELPRPWPCFYLVGRCPALPPPHTCFLPRVGHDAMY
ncbi:hypothetical protein LX32DRAFT_374647 [Colletotrichum zoysiae]|uniref:Uncharacterized protein n=1 Tax=Colletotrichum zoysiae TaxID=1216348 RepID=A0AAD9HSY8_9PEZI|nr:hypothetical protein LX32DRAFT_374647 [Colletotrichum zoysiae]